MAKTLIFKKEHEEKLKKLKIKTKFSKELRRSFLQKDGRDGMIPKTLDKFMSIQKNTGWYFFTSMAFNWKKSEDGYAYWRKILWMG